MSKRKLGPTPLCENHTMGCPNRSISHKTLVCQACYCRVRYAIKKGTAYVIQRRGKLSLWLGTLKGIHTGNVRNFKKVAAR